MPLRLNGTEISDLRLNGVQVGNGYLNGVKVYSRAPAVGTFMEGGYYAGRINIGGVIYNLIVAPRAQGGISGSRIVWKTSQTITPNTYSINNGAANTAAMIAAGAAAHPAANFCNSLNINGYTDWYLPSRDELEICYRYLKPTTDGNDTGNNAGFNASAIPATGNYTAGNPAQTSVTIFQTGNSEAFRLEPSHSVYWTSTQINYTHVSSQWFNIGVYRNNDTKANSFWVRAVRKVPI